MNSSDVINDMYGDVNRLKGEIQLCESKYQATKDVWINTHDESKSKVFSIMRYWQDRKNALLRALDKDFIEKHDLNC